MRTMLIKAEKNENGKWVLVAVNNNKKELVEEGYEHDTKEEAMDLAPQYYPADDTWNGRLFKNDLIDGWLIDINEEDTNDKQQKTYDILKYLYETDKNIFNKNPLQTSRELGYIQGLYEGKILDLNQRNKLKKMLE